MKETIILLIALALSFESQAYRKTDCQSKGPNQLNYSARLKLPKEPAFEKMSYSTGHQANSSRSQFPEILISNCRAGGSLKKELLVTFFPIKNREELASLEDKKRFLKKCVLRRIKQFGRDPLSYRPSQRHCTIERVNSREAIIKGDFCSFELTPSSEFRLYHKIKKECRKYSTLSSYRLSPMSVTVFTGLYSVNPSRSTNYGENFYFIDSRTAKFKVSEDSD